MKTRDQQLKCTSKIEIWRCKSALLRNVSQTNFGITLRKLVDHLGECEYIVCVGESVDKHFTSKGFGSTAMMFNKQRNHDDKYHKEQTSSISQFAWILSTLITSETCVSRGAKHQVKYLQWYFIGTTRVVV